MESEMVLLPVAGAVCLLAALIEGWVMAIMRYVRFEPLRRLFPGYRYLVRSHTDYAMMGILVFVIYFVLTSLELSLSRLAIAGLFVGALYNPFGFLLQSVKPEIAESDSKIYKAGIMLGFLPATYGFGSVCVLVIRKAVSV